MRESDENVIAEISRKERKKKCSIRYEWCETFHRDVIFCVGTHTGLLQKFRTIHHITNGGEEGGGGVLVLISVT